METLTPAAITRRYVEAICDKHQTHIDLVRKGIRDRPTVAALKEISRYLQRDKRWSLPKIGRFVNRDHSTIHWHTHH